jgi:uncharacterized membrane protein
MMKSAAILLLLSFILPVLAYVLEPLGEQSSGFSFVGSLHPMLLHFPIALLCVIPIFEILSRSKNFTGLKSSIRVLLLLTCISAIFTASLGLILYLSGSYSGNTIFYHRWMGATLPSVCCSLYLLRVLGPQKGFLTPYYLLLAVALVFMALTAHEGGKLTHGEMRLPMGMLPWFEQETPTAPPLEEMLVFEHVIQPILSRRCGSCHNGDTYKGELDFDSYEALMAGENSNQLLSVTDHDINSSGLFERLTLPIDNEEVMPPKGKLRLTREELEILAWWLNSGHKDQELFVALEPDEDIVKYVSNERNKKNSSVVRAQREELKKHIKRLEDRYGIPIRFVADESVYVSVNMQFSSRAITDDTIKDLKPLEQHIVELNLENSQVTDESLEAISRMTPLKFLNLRNAKIAGANLELLKSLEHLAVLNISDNDLKSGALDVLNDHGSLEKIYFWHQDT